MSIKPNKETYIAFILTELEKGGERGNVLAKFGKKWQIGVRTFDRYWKTAQERYTERQQAIQKELAATSTEAAVERLKKAILTKDERMEIATSIAKGTPWSVGKEVIIPSAGDRMKALDYMSKVEGDYVPTKVEVGGSLSLTNAPITFE